MVEKVCMDKPWQYGVGGLQQPGGQTIYGGVAVGPPLARLMDAKFMIRASSWFLLWRLRFLLAYISLATGGLMT